MSKMRGRKGLNMTRHHVQRKFEERTALNWIKICGIVSPCNMKGPSPIEYIGETSIEKIIKLKQAFKNTICMNNTLDLKNTNVKNSYSNAFYPNGRTHSRVFPPWIFDYPDYVYRERTEALKDFRATVEEHKQVVKEMLEEMPELLPIMAAAGAEIPVTTNEEQKVIFDFASELANRVGEGEHGLSLPIIYLTVLCHFLNMVRSPDSPGVGRAESPVRTMPFHSCRSKKTLGHLRPVACNKWIDQGIGAIMETWWKSSYKGV